MPHFFSPAAVTIGTPDTLRSKKAVKTGLSHAKCMVGLALATPATLTAAAAAAHIMISPK